MPLRLVRRGNHPLRARGNQVSNLVPTRQRERRNARTHPGGDSGEQKDSESAGSGRKANADERFTRRTDRRN